MGSARSFNSAELLAHAGWVRALAQSLLPADVHQAEDVAQDACLAALEHPPRSDRPLASWLSTVVKNLVRENRRGTRHRGAREAAGAREEALPSTSDVVEQLAMHREVLEAVSDLDEPLRTAILLRYFEELSPRAIAHKQGVPIATVKTRLARGLEKLRDKLDRKHGGDGRSWLLALIPLTHSSSGIPAPIAIGWIMSAQLKIAVSLVAVICGAWFFWPSHGKSTAVNPVLASASESPTDVAAPKTGQAVPFANEVPPGRSERVALGVPAQKLGASLAQPAERTIHGRVLNTDARPLAGVVVYFSVGKNEISSREFNVPTPKVLAGAPTATSDGTGRFEIRAPTDSGELLALDDRWTTVLAGLCGPGSAEAESVVVVAAHLAHRGRVIDDAGRALANVRIAIHLPREFRLTFPQILDNSAERGWFAQSDEQGRFELADAPRLDGATLDASLEGYAPLSEPAPTTSNPSLELVLHRPATKPGMLNGQVVDDHGDPAADARVSVGTTATTVTDANGAFAIELPASGARKTWMAVKPGHQPAIQPASEAVQSGRADEGEFVLLRLGPAPLAISGRVLDADDLPQAGFKVFLVDPTFFAQVDELPAHVEGMLANAATRADIERILASAPEGTDPEEMLKDTSTVFWTFVKTDARGRFTIEGLLARAYRLAAMDPATLLRFESEPIQAGRNDALIRIPRNAYFENVRGKVVTRAGEPLAGVLVMPMADAMNVQVSEGSWSTFTVGSKPVATDAEGRFEFKRLPRENMYLKFGGDDILPLDWGRKQAGGIEAAAKGELDKIVIQVALRYHLQIQVDPDEADEVRILGADGQGLAINVFEGNMSMSSDSVELAQGRSKVLVVGDDARTLVLLKAKQEVRRAPLALVRGGVNIVQL